jgi:hypothetical protein
LHLDRRISHFGYSYCCADHLRLQPGSLLPQRRLVRLNRWCPFARDPGRGPDHWSPLNAVQQKYGRTPRIRRQSDTDNPGSDWLFLLDFSTSCTYNYTIGIRSDFYTLTNKKQPVSLPTYCTLFASVVEPFDCQSLLSQLIDHLPNQSNFWYLGVDESVEYCVYASHLIPPL